MTLAKWLSCTGLLFDIVGVGFLLWNEMKIRKGEVKDHKAKSLLASKATDQVLAEITRLRELVVRITGVTPAFSAAVGMLRRARIGLVLIMLGFALQFLGTLAA